MPQTNYWNFYPFSMTAEEAWKYYKDSVNDSHLIDMFVAQYSSVINCTNCNNSTTQYDPFCVCS